MKLQEKLDSFRAQFESKTPPDKLEIMHRATEDLRKSGIPQRAIRSGDRMPDFVLPNLRGEKVSSEELLRRGPLVITFYRGVW